MKYKFKYRITFSGIIFLLFYLNDCNKVYSQFFNNIKFIENDPGTQLFINPDLLTETEKAIFINALSELATKKQLFDTIEIEQHQSVYSIIKKNYNYNDSKNHKTASLLKDIIKDENDLDVKFSLISGDSLRIPKIPKNPIKGNDKRLAQVFDFVKNESFYYASYVTNNLEENSVSEIIQKSNANLWVYQLSKEDLKTILNSIPNQMQKKLYGEAYITMAKDPAFVEINFPSSYEEEEKTNIYSESISSTLSNQLAHLNSSDFGTYYILDFFNGNNCSHGKKVLSVISERLKEYGLDTLKIKFIPIPINYFQNQDSAIDFLNKYYSSEKLPELTKLEGEATIKALKKLKNNNIQKCENCIPELYLDACMKHYYGEKPDIISTSFFITTTRDIMPNFVSSTTNLVTACLNEPGRTIESLQNRESTINGSSNGAIQPLNSSLLNYATVGSIIVGCQIDKGKFYGMYSSEGGGVTTIGRGIGWNSDCIKPSDKGASFATPDIAIKLLIAKAYWRSNNFKPLALESRTRLLLSSDIDTSFVGKFGSAGQPNLSKLLMLTNGYIENNEGEIVACTISSPSFLDLDITLRMPFKRGLLGISGLSIVDNKVYAFFENSMSWKHIEVKNMLLKITINGIDEVFNSIDQLKLKYKHLVILKN